MSTREPPPPQGSESRNDDPAGIGARHPPPPPARRLWLTREDPADGESFDSLTDLFLGEVARPRREFATGTDAPKAVPAAALNRAEPPRLRLTSEAPEDAPAPQPVATTSAAPVANSEPSFLECLVVGNLPAFASAWASQYVREIARAASCPVAYLRIQAGYVSVEIIDETGDRGVGLTDPMPDLDAALRAARAVTHRWVVRVDHADEPAAAARPGVRLVTLLTGADEAARVHAYGSLKALAEHLPAPEHNGPVVRVAVMGASDPQAEAAIRRLVDTARSRLGRDVQHAPCSSKIRAGRPARMLYNGRIEPPGSLVLDRLAGVLGLPTTPTPAAAGQPVINAEDRAAPNSIVGGAVAGEVAEVEVELTARTAASPEHARVLDDIAGVEANPSETVTIAPTPNVSPTVAAASTPTIPDAPAQEHARNIPARVDDVSLWSAAPEPKAAADAPPGALATFIAGFTPSGVRCPYADGVELALDADGGLHLLARSETPASDDRVIGGLMVASAWAESHAALLVPAIPGLRPGRPVLHLFTPWPKTSRRLADTALRLHLLASVTIGDRSGWYCTELN